MTTLHIEPTSASLTSVTLALQLFVPFMNTVAQAGERRCANRWIHRAADDLERQAEGPEPAT